MKRAPRKDAAGRTMYTWTVRISISETWVEDGFNLTEERLESILAKALPHSYGHERASRVLRSPSPASIRKAQGG